MDLLKTAPANLKVSKFPSKQTKCHRRVGSKSAKLSWSIHRRLSPQLRRFRIWPYYGEKGSLPDSPDAIFDPHIFSNGSVPTYHTLLHRQRTSYGFNSTRKLDQQAIARRVGDTATVLFKQRVDQLGAMRALGRKCVFLVEPDEPRKPRDVSGQYGG